MFLFAASKSVMRPRKVEYWLGLWTLIFFAASAALAFWSHRPLAASAKAPETLALRASDQNGRMRIDWDKAAAPIRSAQGATLEVNDGGVVNRYPVEAKVLRAGGFDYLRKSDDVLLKLTLYQEGKPGPQAFVRSISGVRLAPPAQVVKAEGSDRRERRPRAVGRRARRR